MKYTESETVELKKSTSELKDAHLVENWGTGIKKMLTVEPYLELEELGLHFIVRFPRKVTEKVTENQEKILQLIAEKPLITITELSHTVGISERKLKENIAKLKAKGLLKRIGPDKGGHWEVLKVKP